MNTTFIKYSLATLAMLSFVGAGCSSSLTTDPAPVVTTPPPIVQPPTSQLPEPPPVTSPVIPALPGGWSFYTHTNTQPPFSFGFGYPTKGTSFAKNPNPSFPTDTVFVDLGKTATTNTQAISVPERQLHVRIVDATSPTIKNCFYSESNWPSGYKSMSQQHLTISGQDICLSTESDAGAGNYYNTYNYSVKIGNQFVVMSFIVHSVNCMNYEKPATQCVPFDEQRDSALFKDMMATFKIGT